jgi:hypothetical protein
MIQNCKSLNKQELPQFFIAFDFLVLERDYMKESFLE